MKKSEKDRKIAFTPGAWEDYEYWANQDVKILRRINRIITEILHTPFKGVGKPEPLKGQMQGCWSRRIDQEHRLVYTVEDGQIIILQCRYHY